MKQAVVVGSLNLDYSIGLERMPLPGETVSADSLRLTPGGKGANQAYALGRLGCKTAMIGAVGKDDAGRLLTGNLHSVGVDVSGIRESDTPTGQAFITVERKGENAIIILAGANGEVSADDVDRGRGLIEAADCLVMQLEIPVETVLYAARLAKSLGKMVVLDPAPAVSGLPDELFALADFVKPNETELSILTGMPTDTVAQCGAAAVTLLQKGVGTVLVSLGSKGVLAVSEGMESVLVPAVESVVVDTTAAGDCFTAAFVSAYDGDLKTALVYANTAASIAVSRPGAQASIPSAEEVKERL